jgi:muramidase (phage lysozyme)
MNSEEKLRQFIRHLIIETLELDEVDKDKMKCNKPQRAAAGKKQKKTVKACDKGKEKIIHYGYRGMEDFTQHKDKDRRKSFRARMKCDTAAGKDKLTARYWACKDLW